jgi:adenine-specific DNA-methyltransferase
MPTLDWLNRAQAFTTAARVPYRLLEEVSVHAVTRVPADAPPAQAELVEAMLTDTTSAAPQPTDGNLLIQGDNLEAIKALLPFYRGQVKCIFIDPPYNTKSAFEHYDDNLEHAQWLSMMLPRLQLLRELLREDGSIWVTIDDNEGHYLKVLMDEVFGRGNFVANVLWQKIFSPKNTARHFSEDHDHVLVYAKDGETWRPNEMPRSDKLNASYKNPDNDPRGVWTSGDFSARNFYGAGTYPITCPSGRVVPGPPNGMYWRVSKEKFADMDADRRVWWGADGNNTPRIKRFLSEVKQGVVPQTLWLNTEVGNTQEAKKEVIAIFGGENFMTPKPERLLQRILHIATNPNDLVLDSFLGSGTTAAVAHKMGRRWIGIEMGEHAATHCLPRLQKVIDGEQGGISKAVNWAGGGGFRFMRLGEAVFDETGRIHPAVRFATLAAFIWQQETGAAWPGYGPSANPDGAKPGTPYLGTHYTFDSCSRIFDEGSEPISPSKTAQFACYLLFNGILGDKRPASGNVLTQAVLDALLALHATTAEPTAPLLVYGEACRLGAARLTQCNVSFKHIPYDVKAR